MIYLQFVFASVAAKHLLSAKFRAKSPADAAENMLRETSAVEVEAYKSIGRSGVGLQVETVSQERYAAGVLAAVAMFVFVEGRSRRYRAVLKILGKSKRVGWVAT